MTLFEKLNLLWKFLFLAVFTYGVINLTCCKKSCSSSKKCGKSEYIKDGNSCQDNLESFKSS